MMKVIQGIFSALYGGYSADFSKRQTQDLNQQKKISELSAELARKSAMPGDYRYWEGRYRDEAFENEKLKAEIELYRSGKALLQSEIVDLKDRLKNFRCEASDMQIKADTWRKACEDARRQLELAQIQNVAFRDAVQMFAERYQISPEELAQLGLGTFIPAYKDKPAHVVFGSLEDAKSSIDFAMKNQATVAKFRQLKAHFQKHQEAVSIILDELEKVGKKNVITKTDIAKIRRVRDDVSLLIGRRI